MCWARDITGPLSIQAMEQCNVFWDRLADFPLVPDSNDELSWKWTASCSYTASSADLALQNGGMEQLSSTVQIASGRLEHPFGSSFSFGLLLSIHIGLLIDIFDMGWLLILFATSATRRLSRQASLSGVS